jgi:beta-lactamase class A
MFRQPGLLFVLLAILSVNACSREPTYPDLRDSHDSELQTELDAALADRTVFWEGVKNRDLSVVVADITDLEHPQVAWYNPDMMLYAASMPKIAIALGALVEIDLGNLELNDELRQQLVNMIKRSSNSDATAVLSKVGVERLSEIMQDERYGKLYDPDYGGGLWVGKSYGKGSAEKRDPLHNLSHGASAMQAARFYYGAWNGTILDHKYMPLFKEMFGKPGIKHKFVKGLEGREGLEIYRKSGTWGDFHSDSSVFVRDHLTYIVVAIRQKQPEAGNNAVTGIQVVDDLMLERAARRKPD